MNPLEIKGSTFGSWILLAGLPIFAWEVKIGWINLFMTSFADHPLRFAGAFVLGIFDVSIGLAVAISCLCSIWRSRGTTTVSDEGIQSQSPDSPAVSIAWSDLAELKSVRFLGGIDAIDCTDHVRIRLPVSYLFWNELAPAIDLQLRNLPFGGADQTSAMPLARRGLIFGLYVVSGCFLFLAYAALKAKSIWLFIVFSLVALLLLGLSEVLRKCQVSILVDEGLLRFQRPYFAPKAYRLDTVAEVRICAMSPGFLYVQLLRPGGRPAGIPLFGNNNVLWYRSLRSTWMQTQHERRRDATT